MFVLRQIDDAIRDLGLSRGQVLALLREIAGDGTIVSVRQLSLNQREILLEDLDAILSKSRAQLTGISRSD